MTNKIITKVRVNKTHGQKTCNVPKQEETENWDDKTLVELKEVEVKEK